MKQYHAFPDEIVEEQEDCDSEMHISEKAIYVKKIIDLLFTKEKINKRTLESAGKRAVVLGRFFNVEPFASMSQRKICLLTQLSHGALSVYSREIEESLGIHLNGMKSKELIYQYKMNAILQHQTKGESYKQKLKREMLKQYNDNPK